MDQKPSFLDYLSKTEKPKTTVVSENNSNKELIAIISELKKSIDRLCLINEHTRHAPINNQPLVNPYAQPQPYVNQQPYIHAQPIMNYPMHVDNPFPQQSLAQSPLEDLDDHVDAILG